jgi:hypothetical protein
MRKRIFWFWLLMNTICCSLHLAAQSGIQASDIVSGEKQKFLHKLESMPADSFFVQSLSRYFENEVNGIYTSINADGGIPLLEKEKALRSLVFFIKDLGDRGRKDKKLLYDMPVAFRAYKNVLAALLHRKPLGAILARMDPARLQLIASAFSQYKENYILEDFSVYKRVASSPEYIMQFLEGKPNFRFYDSLLLIAAANNPLKLVDYLNDNRRGIQGKIRSSKNIYIKQIVLLSGEKNASELLPFTKQLAEGKISAGEILGTRSYVDSFFQLMVNTIKESFSTLNSSHLFMTPLRNGLRQKAMSFYVNQLNELHNSPESVRFASVKKLRPEDLYYVITSCGEDLYTSSYLGLYKRLMQHFKTSPADSLFDIVKNDNFHNFIRLAANYNVFEDFLNAVSPQKRSFILEKYVAGVRENPESAVDKAMDIADTFTSIVSSPEIYPAVEKQIASNLRLSIAASQFLAARLYVILQHIQQLIKMKGTEESVWATLGNYELLKHKALENSNGEIVELVLFYGDEDGISSFSSFSKSFSDKSRWEVTKTENWMRIKSLSGNPLLIFANLPLDIKEDKDIAAQAELFKTMSAEGLEPVILVHRGHSYHLEKTLQRLKPSVQLAILGSCGGYNKAISIATMNPDVQVIGSKKTGTKSVNDPILNTINETLAAGKDLYWPEVWKQLSDRFRKDADMTALFNEYFPPSHNLSLFVLKLFNNNRNLVPELD